MPSQAEATASLQSDPRYQALVKQWLDLQAQPSATADPMAFGAYGHVDYASYDAARVRDAQRLQQITPIREQITKLAEQYAPDGYQVTGIDGTTGAPLWTRQNHAFRDFLVDAGLAAAGGIGGGYLAGAVNGAGNASQFVGPTLAQAGGSAATGGAIAGGAAAPGFVGPTLAQAAGPGLATSAPAAAGGGTLAGIFNSPYAQLGALALSYFGGRQPNTNSGSQTTTSTPTLDPAYSPLQQLLLQQTIQRLNSQGPDLGGYEASGISNINKGYGLVGQNLENSLTSRGLADSPVAAAGLTKLQMGRAGDVTNFQNTIPLLRDQYQRNNLQDAIALLTQGRGTTTTGTTSSESGGGPVARDESLADVGLSLRHETPDDTGGLMADVVEAFLRGTAARQLVEGHDQAIEENKLRMMMLKLQLDAHKADNAYREYEAKSVHAGHAFDAANLQPAQMGLSQVGDVPDIPTPQAPPPIQFPGLPPEIGGGAPGFSRQPITLEQHNAAALKQKLDELRLGAAAKSLEPFNLGKGQIRYAVDPFTGQPQQLGVGGPEDKHYESKPVTVDGKPAIVNFDPATGQHVDDAGNVIPLSRIGIVPPQRDPLAQELAGQRLADLRQKATDNRLAVDEGAEGLLDGSLVPSMLSKRGETYQGMLNRASEKSKERFGKPYNAVQSQIQFEGAKRFAQSLNNNQQVRFKGLAQGVVNTIDEVKNLAQLMDNSGIQLANRAEMAAYAQANGNSEKGQLVAQYLGATNTLKEEFANLVNGGYAPTESAFALANKQINENYGVKQMNASLGEVQRLIRYRVNAFNELAPTIPGQSAPQVAAPTQTPAPTIRARDPQGKLHEAAAGTPLPSGWTLER